MARRYKGGYARMSQEVIMRAETLQTLATSRIGRDWDSEEVHPGNPPTDDVITMLEKAIGEGRGQEFLMALAEIIKPMTDQMIQGAAQQQGGGQQSPQQGP